MGNETGKLNETVDGKLIKFKVSLVVQVIQVVITECWTFFPLLQSNSSSEMGPGDIGPPKTEALKGKLFNKAYRSI